MVRVWFLSEEKTYAPKFVTLEELYKTSGVEYYQIDTNNYQEDPIVKNLMDKKDNHFINIVEDLDDNDLLEHLTEHFHEHDEFRLLLSGCGYFDIRDKYDEWLRIELLPGDLIVIPGGCYHRLVVEDKNTFKGVRFLKDYGYKSYKRPSDEMDARKRYMRDLYNGAYEDQRKQEL